MINITNKHIMMKNNILLLFLILALSACTNQLKKPIDSTLPILDLTKDYPKKELDIHEIADVEYIPLETNDSSLIKLGHALTISEKYIITYDFIGPIFIFNRKGKHIRSINHYGPGPKEHRTIFSLAVDFNKEEYYIYEHKKIQVYDFYGEWKCSFKVPDETYYNSLFNYNEQYLICLNEYQDLDYAHIKKTPIDKRPYLLIDKKTSAHMPLSINIEQWMSTTFNARIVKIDKNTSYIESTNLSIIPRMLANSHDFLISEFTKDTLYSYKDNHLTPLAIRHPSVQSQKTPIVISPHYYTDNYLFFKPVELRADKDYAFAPYDKAPLLMWNRTNNEILHITRLYDSNRQGNRDIKANMKEQWIEQSNCVITSIPAFQLCEEYEAGQLKGELKEVASKLKEDDNYVVAIYKFK